MYNFLNESHLGLPVQGMEWGNNNNTESDYLAQWFSSLFPVFSGAFRSCYILHLKKSIYISRFGAQCPRYNPFSSFNGQPRASNECIHILLIISGKQLSQAIYVTGARILPITQHTYTQFFLS